MSDNTHAAMCVYCGEAIIYDTREATDMGAAHAKIVEHDQQCPKNPLVARIEFLNQQNTEQQEQNDALAANVERLRKAMMTASDKHIAFARRIALGKNDTAMQAVDKADALLIREAYHVPVDASCLAKRDLSKRAEGTKMAALFIELKAYAYDEEHGNTDPSTGTREYPGDGAEYYNELMELADELHQQAEGLQ